MFGAFQTFGKLGAIGKAIAAAWSPLSLWPDGIDSPGMWIDPSLLTASFNDSAGTTPVATPGTVADSANPVGLALDIRAGTPVLGPELVTNGDFSNGTTGWSSVASTIAAVDGRLVITPTGTNNTVYTPITTVVGKSYQISATLAAVGGGSESRRLQAGDGPTSNSYISINCGAIPKSVSGVFVATASTSYVNVYTYDGVNTSTWDNISVREIPGNHMRQATSAARPLESARVNLLVATATLSTQSVTVTAIPHTITFSGGGTVTASGAYVGVLTSGQTFTPTAGTLTLTVAGSVTSAMLNRGSTALTYQPVVSASSYSATGITPFQLYDGVDDGMATASFSAGTLIDGMDCMIPVRRDSAATANLIESTTGDAAKYFGLVESGSSAGCVGPGSGTPTVWVDNVQLAGGTAVTRGTLHTALTVGAWHVLEFRGLELSTWTALQTGAYTGYALNGALGDIMLYPSTASTADKDAARQYLADKYGVTLA